MRALDFVVGLPEELRRLVWRFWTPCGEPMWRFVYVPPTGSFEPGAHHRPRGARATLLAARRIPMGMVQLYYQQHLDVVVKWIQLKLGCVCSLLSTTTATALYLQRRLFVLWKASLSSKRGQLRF